MLRVLAGFADTGAALSAAEAQQEGPDRAAGIVRAGGAWRVLLPGDAADEAGSVQPLEAWLRLWPPGGPAPEPACRAPTDAR
jgi:hypothetical protein